MRSSRALALDELLSLTGALAQSTAAACFVVDDQQQTLASFGVEAPWVAALGPLGAPEDAAPSPTLLGLLRPSGLDAELGVCLRRAELRREASSVVPVPPALRSAPDAPSQLAIDARVLPSAEAGARRFAVVLRPLGDAPPARGATGADESRPGTRSDALRLPPQDALDDAMAPDLRTWRLLRASQRRERRLEERARELAIEACQDPLTELPNRRGLDNTLTVERLRAQRTGSHTGVLLLDCDDFKRINSDYGHSGGDAVLREVARRMVNATRPTDTVGRVGGDEFLVVVPDARLAEAEELAERIRHAVTSSPIRVDATTIDITVSVGVAVLAEAECSVDEAIVRTQGALALSKQLGKNRVATNAPARQPGSFRSPTFGGSERASSRRSESQALLEAMCGEQLGVARPKAGSSGVEGESARARLLEALRAGKGLRLVAQPIHALPTGDVVAHEMLTRGPKGPLARASRLFHFFAEHGALVEADLLCARRAVALAAARASTTPVHINLFPSTLLETPFETLYALLTDGPARSLASPLCVELSEQQLVGDPQRLQQVALRLSRAGVRLALDNVAYGRGSLEALILLEPSMVKIDGTAIRGADRDVGRRARLDRLVRVCRALGAKVAAEGVERREEVTLLTDLGVELAQGYYWDPVTD